jgi:hypothetical protein
MDESVCDSSSVLSDSSHSPLRTHSVRSRSPDTRQFRLTEAEYAAAKDTSQSPRRPRKESCTETPILSRVLKPERNDFTCYCDEPGENNQLLEFGRLKSSPCTKDSALPSYLQKSMRPDGASRLNPRPSLESEVCSAASTLARSSMDDGCGEDVDQRRFGRHFSRGHFDAVVSSGSRPPPARSCSSKRIQPAPASRSIRTALDDADAEAIAASRLRASISRLMAGTMIDRADGARKSSDPTSERRGATRHRPTSSFAAAASLCSPRAEGGPEGLLHKRGRWNTAWKARHFVLTPLGTLEYYKAGPDGARLAAPGPLGAIPVALPAGRCGEREGTLVRDGGRDGRLQAIEVTVRAAGPACGRTYVLGAPTAAEHRRWMAALRSVAEAWRGDPEEFGFRRTRSC